MMECRDWRVKTIFLAGPSLCPEKCCLDTAQVREVPRDSSRLRIMPLGAKTVMVDGYMLLLSPALWDLSLLCFFPECCPGARGQGLPELAHLDAQLVKNDTKPMKSHTFLLTGNIRRQTEYRSESVVCLGREGVTSDLHCVIHTVYLVVRSHAGGIPVVCYSNYKCSRESYRRHHLLSQPQPLLSQDLPSWH